MISTLYFFEEYHHSFHERRYKRDHHMQVFSRNNLMPKLLSPVFHFPCLNSQLYACLFQLVWPWRMPPSNIPNSTGQFQNITWHILFINIINIAPRKKEKMLSPIDPWHGSNSCHTKATRGQEPHKQERNCHHSRNNNWTEYDQQWSGYGQQNDRGSKGQTGEN